MDIIFQIDRPFLEAVEPNFIKKSLKSTLPRFSQVDAPSLTIVITDNKTIRRLNRQYRGLNAPTDVLAFENSPDPDFPALEQSHLGDIIIAYPVAKAQALAAGHKPLEELTLLAVHGALHLLGFDHDSPANKKKMWAAQRQIMAELNLAHIQPTES